MPYGAHEVGDLKEKYDTIICPKNTAKKEFEENPEATKLFKIILRLTQ
jgi:hypothetical protein